MGTEIGIDEFVNYWEKLIEEIKTIELTKEDSNYVKNQLHDAELKLERSKPSFWYTTKIDASLKKLESELWVALIKAENNYLKGYGKSEIEAIAQSITEFSKIFQM
jgi:hypothetical protein